MKLKLNLATDTDKPLGKSTVSSGGGDFKVGDIVQFLGGPHYIASTASSPTNSPKAGPAKITIIAKGAPHPYHVIHTDSQSTVYGWVDGSNLSK